MKTTVFRISPLTRVALVSIAVGFLCAVCSVKVTQFVTRSATRNEMFVEDNAGDDITLSRTDRNEDALSWQPGKLHAGGAHDDVMARAESSAIRILCFVMTTSESLSRAATIKATWARRCDVILFMSDRDNDAIDGVPVIRIDSEPRTMLAFDYVFKNYANDADWFLQVDDGTFIIMENMRYFLSSLRHTDPIYFRHHFSAATQRGFIGAGSGYIVSKEALQRLGTRSSAECSSFDDVEDRRMSHCLRSLGVRTGDSRDALGRSRFHCFTPEMHVRGGFPDWYTSYNQKGAVHAGIESISDYAISFHFVGETQLRDLELYIYHIRPYGRITVPLKLNRSPQLQRLNEASLFGRG